MKSFCRAGLQANSEMYVELCPCQARRQHKDPPVLLHKEESVTSTGYVVRRLTPLECERLQGFPDGWTDIKVKCVKDRKTGGYKVVPVEETPDTPRYKAMGNSMAVPCMRWIGERILLAELM